MNQACCPERTRCVSLARKGGGRGGEIPPPVHMAELILTDAYYHVFYKNTSHGQTYQLRPAGSRNIITCTQTYQNYYFQILLFPRFLSHNRPSDAVRAVSSLLQGVLQQSASPESLKGHGERTQ